MYAILMVEIIKILFYLLFVCWVKKYQNAMTDAGVLFFLVCRIRNGFYFLKLLGKSTKNNDVRRLRSRSMRSMYNQLSIWKAQ